MEQINEIFSFIKINKDGSVSSINFIENDGKDYLNFNNLKTLFEQNFVKIQNNETKTQLITLLENFTGNKEKNDFKFVLDKLEPKSNVQVYFDYKMNKLFAVKQLDLNDSKQVQMAVTEVINGYRIKSMPNPEGFVKYYDFSLENKENSELEKQNDLKSKYLNIMMDLCDCSLSDYLKFLSNEIVMMNENDKNEVFDNLFIIIKQLINSLKELHMSNLIHSDIKEANILLMKNINSNYTTKIADFETVLSYDDYIENGSLSGMTKGYVPTEFSEKGHLHEKGKKLPKTEFFKIDVYSLSKVIKRMMKIRKDLFEKQRNICKKLKKFLFAKNISLDKIMNIYDLEKAFDIFMKEQNITISQKSIRLTPKFLISNIHRIFLKNNDDHKSILKKYLRIGFYDKPLSFCLMDIMKNKENSEFSILT